MKSDLPERTFAFAERIVRLCVFLEQNGRVSTTLATQLLRSGTSVGVNVEEAEAAESRKDFVHKYSIACTEDTAPMTSPATRGNAMIVCAKIMAFGVNSHSRSARGPLRESKM